MNLLIGQDDVLRWVHHLFQEKIIPTSFVIFGPRGCGKKTLARILAQGVNCEEDRFHTKCACLSCRKIEQGNHPDVRWIGLDEGSSSIKLDEIHGLIHWAGYKALEARKKVFVIIGAERMTEEAANALLKTLEEPPAETLIFVLTESPGHLRETIVSRCFKLRLRPLAEAAVQSLLIESWGWEAAEASLAAKFSRGSVGRALELKDAHLGDRWRHCVEEILPSPFKGFEKWIGKKRHEVLKNLEILELVLRDLIAWRETRDRNLLYGDISGELFEQWSRFLRTDDVLEILKHVNETRAAIQDNANPKVALARLGLVMEGIYGKSLLSDDAALLRQR